MLLTIYLGRCLPGYESPAMAAQTHGALDMAGQSNIPECGTPSLTSMNAIMDVSLPHSNAEDTSQWAMAGQAAMDISQDDAGCINPRLLSGTAHQPSPPPTTYDGDCPMLGDEDMDQDESHRIPTSMPDPVTECPTVDKGMDDVIDATPRAATRLMEDEHLDDVENEMKTSQGSRQAYEDENCQHDVASIPAKQNGSNGSSFVSGHSILSNAATSTSRIGAEHHKPTPLLHRQNLRQKCKAVSIPDDESDGDEDNVPIGVKSDSEKFTSIWEPETIMEFVSTIA